MILAFILIKFIIFPVLGLFLGTNYPIVAVVSSSMDQTSLDGVVCGIPKEDVNTFDEFWDTCGGWYEYRGISKEDFMGFSMDRGFKKGKVIFVVGVSPETLEVGDTVIFNANQRNPIIHRIVEIKEVGGDYFYTTKGDHNPDSFPQLGEVDIPHERVLGKATFKIPIIGYVKILFVDLINLVRWS